MPQTTERDATPRPAKIFDRIAIAPVQGRLRAELDGTVLAESARALVLEEDGYPRRVHFPPDDVRWDRLARSEQRTHCPWKGDADYWTVRTGTRTLENGAWAYPEPPVETAAIKDHVCFVDAVVVEG